MEKTTKIIRGSIFTFLQNYHYFTTTSVILALPFSLSFLLSQALFPTSASSILTTIYYRFNAVFRAAGFPSSSQFFKVLALKLSQTILTSIFTLPFTLTFLLFAKASIFHRYNKQSFQLSFSSITTLYNHLIHTYIFNSFLLLSANTTAFSLLFLAFNIFEELGFSSPRWIFFFSAAGAVVYSIILANALIICNLALVVSGMERSGGYMAILKACVLIRGRTSTALSLAVPVSLIFAGIEALFQYRIVRPLTNLGHELSPSIGLEGMLIAYLYAVLVVLDTIVNVMFYKSCSLGDCRIDQDDTYNTYHYRIKIADEEEEESK